MSLPVALLLCVIALGAFISEAAVGFGATVIAVTLGVQVVSIDVLLPAFVPVNMCLSAYLVVRHRRRIAWRVLALELAPPVLIGLAGGLLMFRLRETLYIKLAFALFVVTLAVIELWRLRVVRAADPPLARPMAFVLLVLGGFVHGLFGTGGPMLVYVLRRLVDDKGVFRATLALTWLSLNTALMINFASLHLLGKSSALLSAALLVAVLPALIAGERLHRALDGRRFHTAVCLILLFAGSALAVRTSVAAFDADSARAAGGDEQEQETVDHRQLAAVDRRPKVAIELSLPVKLHVGHRHGAAGQERCVAGEQSDRDQRSAHQLDQPAEPDLRPHRRLLGGQQAEDLLRAVEGEQHARDDAQQRVGPFRDSIHGAY